MKSILRRVKVVLSIIICIIVLIVLTAAIMTAILGKPCIMTAIRSNSMYPLLQRGDMVFIKQLGTNDTVKTGDIIVFNTKGDKLEKEGWISHRVVSGNSIDGFVTKGDANEDTDQASSKIGNIKKEWIRSKIIVLNNHPLKIPFVGYLPLWAKNFQSKPFILPLIAIVLALIIGISEVAGDKKKKKHKSSKLQLSLIYICSGFIVAVIVATSMLSTSQHLTLSYEVSETNNGVIMGNNVGILKVGDIVEKPLSKSENKGFLPIICTINTTDKQITPSHNIIKIRPGENKSTTMTVHADKPGKYRSVIHIGMFLPLLPESLILKLSNKSFWLALITISIIPGLPLILYPFYQGALRRSTINEIRRTFRRTRQRLSLG